MSSLLNLDEVSPNKETRIIVMKGVEHTMKAPTVGDFLETSKLAKKIEGNIEQNMDVYVGLMIKIINQAFPTLTEEILQTLTFEQLNVVLEFVNKTGEEITKDGQDKAEGEGQEEGK